MRAKRTLSLIAAAVTVAALAAVGATLGTGADKKPPPKTGFIQGTVTSGGNQAEAGVWVIAETADLRRPTARSSSPTTGRFVLPQLPRPTTGCGCAATGCRLGEGARHRERKAKAASRSRRGRRHAAEEAVNYPANYWLSLFKPPANTQGLPGGRNQHAWVSDFKLGCKLCHQMGRPAHAQRVNRAGLDPGLKKAGNMYGTAIGLGRDAAGPAGRLERAHRRGRDAGGAAAPQGQGAEPGHHPVGLGRQVHLRPRRGRHRQAQPAAQRERPGLGRRPRQRSPAQGRPGEEHADGGKSRPSAASTPRGATQPGADRAPSRSATPLPGGCHVSYLGKYHNPANPHNPMMDDRGGLDHHPDPAERPEDMPAFCKADPEIATTTTGSSATTTRRRRSSSSSTRATARTTCSSTRRAGCG